jgi:hypothetical protein
MVISPTGTLKRNCKIKLQSLCLISNGQISISLEHFCLPGIIMQTMRGKHAHIEKKQHEIQEEKGPDNAVMV